TGSVGSIEMNENLESAPVSDFGSIMHGKVAGVQIQSASGQPGQSSTIKIRGVKSLSAGAMPLLVIDGVVMPEYNLSSINTSEMKTIEELNIAQSIAIMDQEDRMVSY